MLRLKEITITQFRNYQFAVFPFKERIIGICGFNGKGKTNLLDAIYYLCFTKSYFSKTDILNTQFETDGFRLEGTMARFNLPAPPPGQPLPAMLPEEEGIKGAIYANKKDNILCIFRGTGKKELLLNGAPYEKFSEHIGKFPCVMIAPDDIELITGGSENRRRFIDTLLSQLDAAYLQQLIIYTKVLQQRNSLLKQFAESGKTDWALLEVLDDQLLQPGKFVHSTRKKFSGQIISLVQQFYNQIANNEELVTLQYESQLNNSDFEAVLNQYREKDFMLQRTNGGIHKDDFDIRLNGVAFKNIASQGQRKSLLFALKLAEFELLRSYKGFAPLLLLDDVFEKLDDSRMQNLLHRVCKENDGQVIITDTHKERLVAAFTNLAIAYQVIEL